MPAAPLIGNVDSLFHVGADLDLYCDACMHHGGPLIVEELVARYGADCPLESIRRALRCTKCGAKNASVRLNIRAARSPDRR